MLTSTVESLFLPDSVKAIQGEFHHKISTRMMVYFHSFKGEIILVFWGFSTEKYWGKIS